MGKEKLNRLLTLDPVSGSDLYVSELSSDESGIRIKGRFSIPRYACLDEEQAHFLEVFLRSRGMLNSVERELGISYPTVKSRLDSLLEALQLTPYKEEAPKKDKTADKKAKILEQLERGEITAEEAKLKIKEGVGK